MGEAYILRRGSGGIPGNWAVLVARIPSGSTVTATKGGVVLTPMMWVSETYPDQDIALFVFTPAQFDSVNPWTITATDGTNTASETVLITTNKEYEVVIDYDVLLIRNGVLKQELHIDRPANYYTQETGYVKLSSATEYVSVFSNENPIDLTRFNTLTITTIGGGSGYVYGKCPLICIGSSRPTSPTGYANAIQNITAYTMLSNTAHTIPNNTYTLDISTYTGDYYIAVIMAEDSSAYTQWVNVTEFGVKE